MKSFKICGTLVLGALLLGTGCAQTPTMSASGYDYSKSNYSKKFYPKKNPDVNQSNVIGSLNIGHQIDQTQVAVQDQDVDQSIVQTDLSLNTASNTNTPIGAVGDVAQAAAAASGGNQATQTAAQAAEQTQAATIVGDIEDIYISQSNNIGKKDSFKKDDKKFDKKDDKKFDKKRSYR